MSGWGRVGEGNVWWQKGNRKSLQFQTNIYTRCVASEGGRIHGSNVRVTMAHDVSPWQTSLDGQVAAVGGLREQELFPCFVLDGVS